LERKERHSDGQGDAHQGEWGVERDDAQDVVDVGHEEGVVLEQPQHHEVERDRRGDDPLARPLVLAAVTVGNQAAA